MAVKPLSPAEAKAAHQISIPDEIITAVNDMLVSEGASGRIIIRQEQLLQAVAPVYSSAQIFKNHWFDFEQLFRDEGWKVEYDKPGYNESYDPYWVFSPK